MKFTWVTEVCMEITEKEYTGMLSDMRLYIEKMGRSIEKAAATVLHNYLMQIEEVYSKTIPPFKQNEIIMDLIDRYKRRE